MLCKRVAQNHGMKIGYARCSTDEQNLDAQLDALKAAGCEKIFIDEGVSGTVADRDGLSQALAAVMGPGAVLVVWKLDRLGRSLAFLIDLIDQIGRQGAGFQSLTEAIDSTTAGGKLIFHVMGALAEFERALIVERTLAGMKAAKGRGKHVGRPRKLTGAQIEHAREMIDGGRFTVAHMANLYGVDQSTLRRALNLQPN